jgi:hypothetical protein
MESELVSAVVSLTRRIQITSPDLVLLKTERRLASLRQLNTIGNSRSRRSAMLRLERVAAGRTVFDGLAPGVPAAGPRAERFYDRPAFDTAEAEPK